MELKLDANGAVVVQDGKPVYVHTDGKEIAFDAAHAVATINARGNESKQHRQRAEELAAKLAGFEGIEDPEAARKALATMANIDARKLVDAGQVELWKESINKTWQAKLSETEQRLAQTDQQLTSEIIGGAFARSKFIAEKMAFPADIAKAAFGSHFKVENGRLAVYDTAGNALVSRIKTGEVPSFDEAIELIVDMHPQRDSLLRATQQSGSGTPVNGGSGGSKTITRKALEALPHDQRPAALKGAVLVD